MIAALAAALLLMDPLLIIRIHRYPDRASAVDRHHRAAASKQGPCAACVLLEDVWRSYVDCYGLSVLRTPCS